MQNIANIYSYQDNHNKALKFYTEALKIYEKKKVKNLFASCLQSIGDEYVNDEEKRLEYYVKALKIFQEIGDKIGVARCNINIGGVYFR